MAQRSQSSFMFSLHVDRDVRIECCWGLRADELAVLTALLKQLKRKNTRVRVMIVREMEFDLKEEERLHPLAFPLKTVIGRLLLI